MRLHPLIVSLTRHKLTVALMLLATAFTFAIVTNISSMVVHRLILLNAPSGLAEDSIVLIDSTRINTIQSQNGGKTTHSDQLISYHEDVDALRGLAGVESVAFVSGLPLDDDGGTDLQVSREANAKPEQEVLVSAFTGGPTEIKTLGLHLVRGRYFMSSEFFPSNSLGNLDKVSAAIVSRALAERLFHNQNAVGRLFYTSGYSIRIVGVVDHLMQLAPRLGATDNEYAMLLPLEPNGGSVTFVLRTAPQERDRLLVRALETLRGRDVLRMFDHAMTFTQMRAQYFQSNRAMIGLLLAAGLALLVVTAAGVAGLAGFWVRQRTHSIGIRRAIGATRTDILLYFQIENALIVTGGVVLGCILAYVINLLLMKYYSLQVLSPLYLAVGALALWAAGQAAVIGPALRAAAVPPAVAARST